MKQEFLQSRINRQKLCLEDAAKLKKGPLVKLYEIYHIGEEEGYSAELFKKFVIAALKVKNPHELIPVLRNDWKNVNQKEAKEIIENLKLVYPKKSYTLYKMARDFSFGIPETHNEIQELKTKSSKLENKPLKLKEETMNFNHLQRLIKKAILYKRRHLKEDGEIVKKEKKLPTSKNKKIELKKIYKKILTGTPYEENIPVFLQLIDASPDSYINYEMGINLENAMEMVDELIRGSGDFTTDELKNIVNITRGVGFPAIEHYAAGGKAMPKETQVFGAHHMDQNVNELMGSIKQRKDPSRQLPAPEKKELGTTMPDTIHREVLVKKFDSRLAKIIGFPNIANTEFGNIASKMKSSGMNTNRMASAIAKIILGSTSYEEAKKEAEQKLHLDFDKGEDLFRSMWKEKARQEAGIKRESTMTIKDYLVCEEAKKEIDSILESKFDDDNDDDEYMGYEHLLPKYGDKKSSTKQDDYDLLPMLSKQDNRKLKARIKMLKLLGDTKGVDEVMQKINQRRREHNIPQLTPSGVATALAAVKDMPPFTKGSNPSKDFSKKKSTRYTNSTGPR
jgi:hypothetical protein